MVKNLPASAGDLGLIPGWGWSPGEGRGNPLQYSGLENPRDGGAWWAAVYGVAQSRTRLKRLSSPSKQLRLSLVAFLCPVFHNVFLMHHIVTHLCKEYNTFLRTKRVHSLGMLSVCRLYTTWANVADLGKAAATLMLWDSLWNGKNYENPRLDMKSYKVDHFNVP